MKKRGTWMVLIVMVWATMGGVVSAQRSSLLDNDPEVVYTSEFSDKSIELLVAKPGPVYSTKKGKFGGSLLGQMKPDTKVTLIGFNETAYQIRGTSDRGGVSGWVSPKILASKDKDFIENLKKVYRRQIEVREMIANQEVAIGMSLNEVEQSLGRPTKTKVRRTAKGQNGQWEYIEYEEIKHYQNAIHPVTGNIFRQVTHVTQEEVSKLVVEFEDDVVTALEESESQGSGQVRVIVPPLVLVW